MTRAVRIPVTVKMRKGWDDAELNAPTWRGWSRMPARRAIAIHGRTAKQSYAGLPTGISSPRWRGRCASRCSAAATASSRSRSSASCESGVSGVLVGRGVLRNPWILAQAAET